jgi:hypothetical protein
MRILYKSCRRPMLLNFWKIVLLHAMPTQPMPTFCLLPLASCLCPCLLPLQRDGLKLMFSEFMDEKSSYFDDWIDDLNKQGIQSTQVGIPGRTWYGYTRTICSTHCLKKTVCRPRSRQPGNKPSRHLLLAAFSTLAAFSHALNTWTHAAFAHTGHPCAGP